MSIHRHFLQFSLRTMLLATFVAIVAGQSYRIVVYERRVRAERDALLTKVDTTIAKNHDRPPRCGILVLGSLCRELDKSPVYQQMPIKQRAQIGSQIEAARSRHFARGDQWAAITPKAKPFIKADDMLSNR
jgi:hypothetical protein